MAPTFVYAIHLKIVIAQWGEKGLEVLTKTIHGGILRGVEK